MATIGDFFSRADFKDKKRVAARLENPKKATLPDLYYYQMDINPRPNIPPSVYLLEGMDAAKIQPKGRVLVNYSKTDWLNSNSNYEENFESFSSGEYSGKATPVPVNMTRWDQFSLDKLGPKPKALKIFEDSTIERGNSRARRVYMLAAFCLLNKAGTLKGWKTNGHNIASLLVSDAGEVLSWGVNDGSYRHAEVNTLISYFLRNRAAAGLPKKSVLFTTLKPCLMCSQFVKSTWDTGDIKVWYGMTDSGESGGTPLLGSKASTFKGETVAEGDEEFPDVTTGTKPVQVAKGPVKVGLTTELNKEEKKRKGSAADWVDTSSDIAQLFKAAHEKFVKKAGKIDRDDGPMKQVLDYLSPWLL
jgi:tRNA(Arg) A34 adenosine deaminase TadA